MQISTSSSLSDVADLIWDAANNYGEVYGYWPEEICVSSDVFEVLKRLGPSCQFTFIRDKALPRMTVLIDARRKIPSA